MTPAKPHAPSRRKAAAIQLTLGYVSVGVTVAQGIVMVPLYLHFISARLYGLWLATGGVTVWLGMLDFGIASLIGQRIAAAYGRGDTRGIANYYFNGLMVQTALIGVLVVVGGILSWFLPQILHATGAEIFLLRKASFLACVATGCTFLNTGQKGAADALQRPLVPMIGVIGGGLLAVGCTAALLFLHHGLISLPIGMFCGALCSLLFNFTYVTKLVRKIDNHFSFDRNVLRDMLALSPAMFGCKTGIALVSRIEPTLISMFLSPEASVAFSLTKRAADISQMLTDRVVGAVVPGFAHLYAAGDTGRAAQVLRTLISLTAAFAITCLGVYLACNRSFIDLWVGPRFYAGNRLTMFIALAVLSLMFNNLFSMLLGAVGDIAWPCWMVLAEAGCRLSLMLALLHFWGMPGLPCAVLLSSGTFTLLYAKRLFRWLKLRFSLRLKLELVGGGAVLLLSGASGFLWRAASWPHFLAYAVVTAAAATLIFVGCNPSLRKISARLLPR